MIESLALTDLTDVSGTVLLFYIALKLTRFDMLIKGYSAVIKKILNDCPLFKDKTACIQNIPELNNIKGDFKSE